MEDPDSNPLLVFPEGTCVNNEYTVMFKKVGQKQQFFLCAINSLCMAVTGLDCFCASLSGRHKCIGSL